MEVFALGLRVKEEGEATVTAATNRLRGAVRSVGDESLKSGVKAARSALAFSSASSAIATAGTVTGGAASKLIAAGSSLATMFGPAGLIAGSLVGLVASFKGAFDKINEEVRTTLEETRARTLAIFDALNSAAGSDVDRQREDLRRIREGDRFVGAMRAGLTPEELRARGMNRLRSEVVGLEREISRLAEADRKFREGDRSRGVVGVAALARRELPGLRDQLRGAQNAIADLARIESGIVKIIDAGQRLDTVPALSRVLGTPGAGTTAVGSRFSETIAEEQKKISAAMTGRLNAITLANREARRVVAEEAVKLREEISESVGSAITDGVVSGIESGIARGSIGEGFRAMGAAMLSGLGSAMIDFGVATMKLGTLMQGVVMAFSNLFPGGAIARGAAMVALGAALKGVAGRVFGGMGGGGFGSFSPAFAGGGAPGGENVTRIVFGPTTAGVAAGMTPRSFNNWTIIGPGDPTAQRAIEEILRRANDRGGL